MVVTRKLVRAAAVTHSNVTTLVILHFVVTLLIPPAMYRTSNG